jgi:Relaxase/Mobilisation nuclease domain
MSKRIVRMPSAGSPLLDIFSHARLGPAASRFTTAQIEQIRRTVRRVPEVLVKVTGGGRKLRAVADHLSYISHDGELELETDDGRRVPKGGQKELLRDWHLELSAGQYRRPPRGPKTRVPGIKLVHNVVLSMPAPTPPEKVLAAAKVFAREKFGARHRYAMALHIHQQHPHVHLVVKAEGLDGRRLHIDKAMLREWREDFARMMREQGVPANATPRAVRGRNRGAERDARFRTRRRGSSYALREKVHSVARELTATHTIRDPAHAKLAETRKAVVAAWKAVADTLEAQGEIVLGGDVRYFAMNLPQVRTDREQLAAGLVRSLNDDRARDRAVERTR